VLDLFVTLNIAAAVSLLLVAIYVSEALRIATSMRRPVVVKMIFAR
jgi:type III secretory pathway component EscV